MSNIIDADKFMKSIIGEVEPPTVRLYGQDWVLPLEIPVIVRLSLEKATNPDEELPYEDQVNIIKALLGQEQFDRILEAGLTGMGISTLIVVALSTYSGGDPNEALDSMLESAKADAEETNSDADIEEAPRPKSKSRKGN